MHVLGAAADVAVHVRPTGAPAHRRQRHTSPAPGNVSAFVALGLRQLLLEQMGEERLRGLLASMTPPNDSPSATAQQQPSLDMAAAIERWLDPSMTCADEVPEPMMVG